MSGEQEIGWVGTDVDGDDLRYIVEYTVDDEGWYRVAPDVGAHGVPMGTIAKPDDGTDDYVSLSRVSHGLELTTRADDDGRIWVLFGTDSAFEGPTSIYYTSVTIFLDPQA